MWFQGVLPQPVFGLLRVRVVVSEHSAPGGQDLAEHLLGSAGAALASKDQGEEGAVLSVSGWS